MLWNGNESGKTKVMRISRETSQIQIMMDKKQMDNVEYFDYLNNMITNAARCKREIKFRIATGKAAFNRKKTFFTSKLHVN
jgi:hypothetical protein